MVRKKDGFGVVGGRRYAALVETALFQPLNDAKVAHYAAEPLHRFRVSGGEGAGDFRHGHQAPTADQTNDPAAAARAAAVAGVTSLCAMRARVRLP